MNECRIIVGDALVALRHGREAVLIELNPQYAEMARRRIEQDAPLLNRVNIVNQGALEETC